MAHLELGDEACRPILDWLRSPEHTDEDNREAGQAALTLIEHGARTANWPVVEAVAKAAETLLAGLGWWGSWQATLQRGLHAAQQLGDDVIAAYFAHQLGVDHLLTGTPDLAAQH